METNYNGDGLFQEFPPVTTEQWEAKILADLKGADYSKKLIWNTDEEFAVRPYYRQEDTAQIGHLSVLPGEEPFTRGSRPDSQFWTIRQDIPALETGEANALAREAVTRGASGIGLDATEISSHQQMSRLLQGIDIGGKEVHFTASRSYPLTLELLIYEIRHQEIAPDRVKGSLNFDPVGFLIRNGEFYGSFIQNIEEAVYLMQAIEKNLPSFRAITVNGRFFQDAGSTLVQELAFSLAIGNEYLAALTEKGFSAGQVNRRMLFHFSIGPNYFLEIAKFRAARMLWATVTGQYPAGDSGHDPMFIHASTAWYNKSIYDPFVNILRTTTEGMAAAIGNADSIVIGPFDGVYKKPDEFSLRIARNQQLILKEESYLDKVIDPAAGSYYIENLTSTLAEKAWDLFREVEKRGGFLECFKAGYIQDEVGRSRAKKEADVARRGIMMVGTNQYPNIQERMLEKTSLQEADAENGTSYTKLPAFRLAAPFEKLRLETESYVARGHKRPSVFLFTTGNLAMLRARAGFVTNFFGCAGYEILDNPGFAELDEGISQARQSGAEIVVFCSSDEEYPGFVPQAISQMKAEMPGTLFLIAGYPKDALELLRSSGVDDFIHVRSNLLETLNKFHIRIIH